MKISKKPTRHYSKKQEQEVARYLNGKIVPNSGATKFNKGDVELLNWLVECKTKTTKHYVHNIREEWLKKNTEEAFAMGKSYSALCFDFEPGGDRYYIIDEKMFKRIVRLIADDDNSVCLHGM